MKLMRKVVEVEDKLLALKADYAFRRFMLAFKAGFNRNQPRDERGRWSGSGGVTVTTSPRFYTGIQSIDETSDVLIDTLKDVVNKLGYLPGLPASVYGTFVHGLFAAEVSLKGLPGVGDIERTFSLDDADPSYGLVGSIRTDLTLRNIQGDIVAIYDVKTGNARMSPARANRLREKTGAAPNTPVFELNVTRGISRKSFLLSKRRFS